MIMLIITTIGCFISALFLIALPWIISMPVSLPIHIVIICLSSMNCWIVGTGLAEIVYQWKRNINQRHYTRFFWYREMGLFESAQLVEPKMAEDY
ncbi:hypothetical protein LCGC14_1619000 [marine sediment metagenome]|uniref:Uncharacterized protein n=1 Tax=marine sediment metagenome TaxID=412755 RepID=A0A0F9KLQ8_9ZZZZ